MDDSTAAGLAILLVFIWYGVIRLAGRLRPPQWQASVVWCARIKCMSLIETAPPRGKEKNPPAICHCLLWPELHDCDQRCIH